MRDITQIRVSGFGGQGVILAGVLLGEAGVADGRYVAGSASYGAQARGSGCKAEIIFPMAPSTIPISPGPISWLPCPRERTTSTRKI